MNLSFGQIQTKNNGEVKMGKKQQNESILINDLEDHEEILTF